MQKTKALMTIGAWLVAGVAVATDGGEKDISSAGTVKSWESNVISRFEAKGNETLSGFYARLSNCVGPVAVPTVVGLRVNGALRQECVTIPVYGAHWMGNSFRFGVSRIPGFTEVAPVIEYALGKKCGLRAEITGRGEQAWAYLLLSPSTRPLYRGGFAVEVSPPGSRDREVSGRKQHVRAVSWPGNMRPCRAGMKQPAIKGYMFPHQPLGRSPDSDIMSGTPCLTRLSDVA